MPLNPISLIFLLLEGLTVGGKLHAVPDEISNYQYMLNSTLHLLDHVKRIRNSTRCVRSTEERIDQQLQNIKFRIKEIEKSTPWGGNNKSRIQKVSLSDRVAWHFVHSHVATPNEVSLSEIKKDLQTIQKELKGERPLHMQTLDLRRLEETTNLALLKRFEKNKLLYSGSGTQMSRLLTPISLGSTTIEYTPSFK